MPQLEQRNIQAWALDVLGWGFTDRSSSVITDFSPAAKRAHLKAFIDQHVGAPVTLVGASLGFRTAAGAPQAPRSTSNLHEASHAKAVHSPRSEALRHYQSPFF